MRASVLLPIHPRFCRNIIKGEKTVEVRKVRPTCELPFRCLIYETREEDDFQQYQIPFIGRDGKPKKGIYEVKWIERSGKVIGEFVCDKCFLITRPSDIEIQKATCLTESEMLAYGNDKDIYGWHISHLKIYDKPKELREFTKPLESVYCSEHKENGCDRGCIAFGCFDYYCKDYWDWAKGITRPPQNFMYVEENEERI